ncbi:MAG TPA: TolC family protein [Pirellulales bacterium]|jgi:NodT family efflux transporter outer membrane factor (OMF) lipoprotein|nr:TolC family protein [Pirellulales bacterium]
MDAFPPAALPLQAPPEVTLAGNANSPATPVLGPTPCRSVAADGGEQDTAQASHPPCPAAGKCAGRGLGCPRLARWMCLLVAGSLVGQVGCVQSLNQWAHNHFKLGPNYTPPPAPVSPQWVDIANPQADADPKATIAGQVTRVSHVTGDPVQDCAWWTVFNDPTLNGLITSAYGGNLDMRTAVARVVEARGRRGIAIGNLFPQSQALQTNYAHGIISNNLGGPLSAFGGPVDVWVAGGNISWELDVWGRLRRNVESSNANLDRSVEDYGAVMVMTLADVATYYVQMRTYEERLRFAERNVIIQRNSLQLAQERFDHGVATELDVIQARSNLAQTESIIPPLIAGRRQAANQLCILLGYPVTDLADQLAPGGIPRPPVEVAIGVPADLLRRRPDVGRAERDVAAQSAQIGVAMADLYPRLSINGFLGYAANDLSDLFTPKSLLAIVLPTVQWNILNYGRIANNIRVQDARLEQNALQYQETVLKAGREVEDALVGFVQAQQQAARLEASVREAEKSVQLVVIQFEGGITDFNRVFNAQTLLVNQQDQLAQARGSIALNLIQVYRGLGGGWEFMLQGACKPTGPGICPAPPGSVESLPAGRPVPPTEPEPKPPAAEPSGESGEEILPPAESSPR